MPVITIPIQDFSDIVPEIQYVCRRCRSCGHHNSPVIRQDDDYKNKCPKCSGVMVSSIRIIPFGKVMIYEEEELKTSSIRCCV